MKKTPIPSVDYLKECFTYDPETGFLYWKERPAEHFLHCKYPEQVAKACNTKYAFKEALGNISTEGYKQGILNSIAVKAHRVIYKLLSGKDVEYVDHINGLKLDNRFSNLREATASENSRNRKTPINNSSGVIGVYKLKADGKWKACMRIDGKLKHLGTFSNMEEAIFARKSKEKEMNYHENHGRKLN